MYSFSMNIVHTTTDKVISYTFIIIIIVIKYFY